MVIFTKKFGTLDPHLPIVWDKVQKKQTIYFWDLPLEIMFFQSLYNYIILDNFGPSPSADCQQKSHIQSHLKSLI